MYVCPNIKLSYTLLQYVINIVWVCGGALAPVSSALAFVSFGHGQFADPCREIVEVRIRNRSRKLSLSLVGCHYFKRRDEWSQALLQSSPDMFQESLRASASPDMFHVYIYIYIEREREIDRYRCIIHNVCICVYVCIYIYIHTYV